MYTARKISGHALEGISSPASNSMPSCFSLIRISTVEHDSNLHRKRSWVHLPSYPLDVYKHLLTIYVPFSGMFAASSLTAHCRFSAVWLLQCGEDSISRLRSASAAVAYCLLVVKATTTGATAHRDGPGCDIDQCHQSQRCDIVVISNVNINPLSATRGVRITKIRLRISPQIRDRYAIVDPLPAVVKVVMWSGGGLTWRSQVGANPIPIPHPTNLASFGHKITLYRFNQGAHTIAGRIKSEQGAESLCPPHFNHWLSVRAMYILPHLIKDTAE